MSENQRESGLFVPAWYAAVESDGHFDEVSESYDDQRRALSDFTDTAHRLNEQNDLGQGASMLGTRRNVIAFMQMGIGSDSIETIDDFYRSKSWYRLPSELLDDSTKKVKRLSAFALRATEVELPILPESAPTTRDLNEVIRLIGDRTPDRLQSYVGGMRLLFGQIPRSDLETIYARNPNALATLRQQTSEYISTKLQKYGGRKDNYYQRGEEALRQVIDAEKRSRSDVLTSPLDLVAREQHEHQKSRRRSLTQIQNDLNTSIAQTLEKVYAISPLDVTE